VQKFSSLKFLNIIPWPAAFLLLGMSVSSAWWYKFWVFEILGTAYLWFAGATVLLFRESLDKRGLSGG
jgi:hypothetical protein